MNLGDTIVAVSSPAGAGERAIVRLSGPRAVEIAASVFAPDDQLPPSRERKLAGKSSCHRSACDEAGAAGDTGELTLAARGKTSPARLADLPSYATLAGQIALKSEGMTIPATLFLMRQPRSYTREDVVELHLGAWPAVVPLVVAALVSAGARAAAPGEFTLRALMSGRLDLAQAEAVMAVIGAGDRAALRAAGEMLAGRLSGEVERMIDRLREVLALVEADLDFADQNIEVAPPAEIAARLTDARRELADLGRRSRGLETFGGDVRLVIAGRPNAGKSSLFNRLLAADRAIVAPVAGTTRDELRAALHVGGLTFTLSDVAGLDVTRGAADAGPAEISRGACPASTRGASPAANADGCDIADKARAKALEAIGRADLVIVAVEATAEAYDDIDDLLFLVAAPTVVVITKCDLAPPDRARAAATAAAEAIVPTSAATGQGIDELRAALVRAVEGGAVDREAVGLVMTARHRAAMEQAAGALTRAVRVARRPDGAGELVAVELREALEALGSITGRQAAADVLDEIFARFCIGK
jgi:tRNA modification GTPase